LAISGATRGDFCSVSVEADNEGLPKLDSFDGLIVPGSEHGVYDNRPWMAPLRNLLLETKKAGKPIYGICFGHQMMAGTFGGKAEKSQIGNVVGVRQFDFNTNTNRPNNGPLSNLFW
jgi:GMP synthase-like glutamine amidotransferase